MESNGELLVTWKQFVVTILPLLIVPVSAVWLLVNSHASQPIHPGAVSHREFTEHKAEASHTGAVKLREFERVIAEMRDVKATLGTIEQTIGRLNAEIGLLKSLLQDERRRRRQ